MAKKRKSRSEKRKEKKKAKIDTWKGWEDKVELVDKLPPLSDDEKPLTVKELEAKGFRGERVEDYEKRIEEEEEEEEEESEVSKRERPRRDSEKTNPFRDVSGVSRGKKERDSRGPAERPQWAKDMWEANKRGFEDDVAPAPKERDFRRPEDKESSVKKFPETARRPRQSSRRGSPQQRYESPFEPLEAPDSKPVKYTKSRDYVAPEKPKEDLPRTIDPKKKRKDSRAVTSSAADAAFSDMESEIDKMPEDWEGSTFEQRKMTPQESKDLRERSRAAKSRTSTRTKKPTEEPISEDLPREIDLPEGSTSPDPEAEKFYAEEEERLGTLYKVTKEEGEDIVDERAGFGGFLKGVGGAIKRKATGDDRPAYIREPENEAVVLEVNLKELAPNRPRAFANNMARRFAQRHYMDTYLADEYEESTDASTRTRKVKGDIKNLSPSYFYDDDSGILFVTYKPRNVLWNGKNMLEEQEQ